MNVREIVRKASGESLDLKAYEADMRHLIDTYIEADEPRTISPFHGMGLLELIVKTGIAEAIASQLAGTPAPPDRVAEAGGEYMASGDPALALALRIDEAVKRVRPDGWRGVQTREQTVKAALYGILRDQAEVERVFLIIKAQGEY